MWPSAKGISSAQAARGKLRRMDVGGVIVGALLGLGLTHFYYRLSRADSQTDLATTRTELAALRASVERLVVAGTVVAVRDVGTGQITGVSPPTAPTGLVLTSVAGTSASTE
jgi:hypothetical protein